MRHADGQLPAQRFAFGVVACEPQPRQLEMFNADVRVLEEVRLPRGSCEQFFGQLPAFVESTDSPRRAAGHEDQDGRPAFCSSARVRTSRQLRTVRMRRMR